MTPTVPTAPTAPTPCQHIRLVKAIIGDLVKYHCSECPQYFNVAKLVLVPKTTDKPK